MTTTNLLWFRNDLRIHDNQSLHEANQQCDVLIPVYCFDPRHFEKTYLFGFEKTGFYRTKFLLESIQDLRQSLLKLDSGLIVKIGKPEDIIPALVREYKVTNIYFQREVTYEEVNVEDALTQQLQSLNCTVHSFEGHTLYSSKNLPFHINSLPNIFTQFRNQIEKNCKIEPALPSLTSKLKPLPENLLDKGNIPSIKQLGVQEKEPDSRNQMNFIGGEAAALKRLKEYIWDLDLLKVYKQTRNGLLGINYSSKFSPWLANGCLSPKRIYEEVQKFEQEKIKNESTYWLIFELLWRDFFRFTAQKHGKRLFYSNGIQANKKVNWKTNPELFEKWSKGQTGIPFIDANMLELNATGFMSNRGRQNVASYLTKHLGLDWRMGAEYFESLLIDYDVCSNYANWAYIAGVGNDPIDRVFNPQKQAEKYDPNNEYVDYWLPQNSSEIKQLKLL